MHGQIWQKCYILFKRYNQEALKKNTDVIYNFYWSKESMEITCLRNVPVMNQKLLLILNWFSITSFSTTLSKTNENPIYIFHQQALKKGILCTFICLPWMWIVPFIRRESGHHKEGEANEDIRSQHVSESSWISLVNKNMVKYEIRNKHKVMDDLVLI